MKYTPFLVSSILFHVDVGGLNITCDHIWTQFVEKMAVSGLNSYIDQAPVSNLAFIVVHACISFQNLSLVATSIQVNKYPQIWRFRKVRDTEQLTIARPYVLYGSAAAGTNK